MSTVVIDRTGVYHSSLLDYYDIEIEDITIYTHDLELIIYLKGNKEIPLPLRTFLGNKKLIVYDIKHIMYSLIFYGIQIHKCDIISTMIYLNHNRKLNLKELEEIIPQVREEPCYLQKTRILYQEYYHQKLNSIYENLINLDYNYNLENYVRVRSAIAH